MPKKFYDGLPHPFSSLPLPGEPITTGTVADVVIPLLQTIHCVLDMFVDATQHEALQSQYLSSTLMTLNSSLSFSIEILERLTNGENP